MSERWERSDQVNEDAHTHLFFGNERSEFVKVGIERSEIPCNNHNFNNKNKISKKDNNIRLVGIDPTSQTYKIQHQTIWQAL